MVFYTVKSTGLLEGKSIEGFIDNFRNLQKVTHCWSCRRTLDQNKEELEECIVCGGIKCPDDDNCLFSNPVYGDHYKPSKGRIIKRE